MNIEPPQPTTEEKAKAFDQICDLLGIGALARSPATVCTSVTNLISFSEKLHAIEQNYLMKDIEGESHECLYDGEIDVESVCLVNSWSDTTEEYVEKFGKALELIKQENQK